MNSRFSTYLFSRINQNLFNSEQAIPHSSAIDQTINLRGRFVTLRMMLLLFALLIALLVTSMSTSAQEGTQSPTAFSYQGSLTQDGEPANGSFDFQVTLFQEGEAQNGEKVSKQVGEPSLFDDVSATNGTFSLLLDFGPWQGEQRALEIGVRKGNSNGAFTLLNPRQPIEPVPLALALPGFRTEEFAGIPTIIGGFHENSVSPGSQGSVLVGGGTAGRPNQIISEGGFNVVVGGMDNHVVVGAQSTIVGGQENRIVSGLSFIGGGRENVITGTASFIGGGTQNVVHTDKGTIGGGQFNRATGEHATVGGGSFNKAGDDNEDPFDTRYPTVAGGQANIATATGATVGGGRNNSATSIDATIPGGTQNIAAGSNSFAAGKNAQANHDGSFVWSDGTGASVTNTANQFFARASGGFVLFTGTGSGVLLNAGSGTWSGFSDRNAKENLKVVNGKEVLEAVAAMPISTWNYKTQDESIRHIGPMAQDFYAAFGVGENERYIGTVDADGVGLAAIQGLYQVVLEQQQLIDELTERVAQLEEVIQ